MKHNHFLLHLTVAILALLLASSAQSASYYVDSTLGDDSTGDGTSGAPWKTITHAATSVPAGDSGDPNVINIAAGTYATINGESFPVNLANDYVSLNGAAAATTIIMGDGPPVNHPHIGHPGITIPGVNLLDITAQGITIQNLSFANTGTAISSLAGGLTLSNNIFTPTSTTGLYLYIHPSALNAAYNLDPIVMDGNTFACTGTGALIDVLLQFDGNTGHNANLGGITASNNTFTIGTAQTGLDISTYAVDSMAGGTISAGPVTVSGNTFTGGHHGFSFYGYFDNLTDTALTVGNLAVSNNSFSEQTTSGMLIDYYDLDWWYGAGTGTLGSLTIRNNQITTSAPTAIGIDLSDLGYLNDLNGSVAVTTGPVTLTGNTISTGSHGIYIYFNEISYFGDNDPDTARTTLAGTTISANTVTSANGSGIYLYLRNVGRSQIGRTRVDFGGVAVQNNSVQSAQEGLYTEFDLVGYDMWYRAQLTMSPFTVSGNTITSSASHAVHINYFDYDVGSLNNENSSVTLPDWTIANNTLDTTGGLNGGSGIYFYTFSNPWEIYDSAATRFGALRISNNTINPDKNGGLDMGVDLFVDDFCDGCFGSSTASFGDITVRGNTIYNAGRTGINAWFGEVVFEVGATAQVSMGKSSFAANTINGAATGIALDIDDAWSTASAAVVIGDQEFLDNTVSNVSQQGILFEVDANSANPGGATLAVNRALINGNTLSGGGGALRGISLFGDIGSGVTFGTPQVTSNTVNGFAAGILLDEGSLYNGLAAATIRGNTVQNNVIGLQVNGAGSGYDAACNTLVGNSGWGLAVNDGVAATVKAEHNWWGDAAGPAACAGCNAVNPGNLGSVDFTPWLALTPDKASFCRGGFPWPMFLPAITHPRP